MQTQTVDMTNVKGVKVFSATMAKDREELGNKVTEWLKNSRNKALNAVVSQSSDEAFHCLSITVFYTDAN